MAGLTVRSLAAISTQVLCEASNEAFRDYAVSVQMNVRQLDTMLRQNDVVLELSAGLFDSQRLIGFWLNGVRTLGGRKVGYDSGTAICKPYRGRGLSRKLAALSEAMLIDHGVKDYVLEVLTQNEPAYRMYLKDGFRVTRRLLCLKTASPPRPGAGVPAGFAVDEGPLDTDPARPLPPMEYRPSWQHTSRSMVNIRDHVHVVQIRRGTRTVGYGMILPERGRITQIAVDEAFWNGPLPASILERLCRAAGSSTITCNNVDPGAPRTLQLLRSQGFETYVDQWEMARSLGT